MSPRVAGIDVSGRGVGRTALAWLDSDGVRPRLVERPVDDPSLRGPDGDRRITELVAARRPSV